MWEHQPPNDKLASPCCLYYSLKNKYKICFILPWYDSITKIMCYLLHGMLKFLVVASCNQRGVRYFIKWGTLGYFVVNNSIWCFAMNRVCINRTSFNIHYRIFFAHSFVFPIGFTTFSTHVLHTTKKYITFSHLGQLLLHIKQHIMNIEWS